MKVPEPIVLKVDADWNEALFLDTRKVKKALRSEGNKVMRIARRLVARKAISKAGEFPGMRSGALMRSIKVRVSRTGLWVFVGPVRTPEMGDEFHPAFLYYGSRKAGLAKRANYMTAALDQRRAGARQAIKNALRIGVK